MLARRVGCARETGRSPIALEAPRPSSGAPDAARTVELLDTALRNATAASPAALDEVERRHVMEVLSFTGGNVTQAARILGIYRVTLYNKMRRYQLRD